MVEEAAADRLEKWDYGTRLPSTVSLAIAKKLPNK